MFQLDLKSRKSIYEQIVDNLKDLMISGVLKEEEKLPSVRELSKMLTVNPNTIQKSYRELERQGYVYTASGLGTFVCDRESITIDRQKKQEITSLLRQSINELYYLGFSTKEVEQIIESILKEKR